MRHRFLKQWIVDEQDKKTAVLKEKQDCSYEGEALSVPTAF